MVVETVVVETAVASGWGGICVACAPTLVLESSLSRSGVGRLALGMPLQKVQGEHPQASPLEHSDCPRKTHYPLNLAGFGFDEHAPQMQNSSLVEAFPMMGRNLRFDSSVVQAG